jgi:hypothetical protein
MSQATKNLWAGPTPNYELVACACELDACCLAPGEIILEHVPRLLGTS